MALASSDEMKVWLNYCHDLGYLTTNDAQRLKTEYITVAKMLYSLSENWTSKT
jgi:four helix bundle protein